MKAIDKVQAENHYGSKSWLLFFGGRIRVRWPFYWNAPNALDYFLWSAVAICSACNVFVLLRAALRLF